MVSEATAAYSSGVGLSPNGATMLAGPYPLDGFGTRIFTLLPLLLPWLFTLRVPLLPWLLSWPFPFGPRRD
jgi:hypothetical protein